MILLHIFCQVSCTLTCLYFNCHVSGKLLSANPPQYVSYTCFGREQLGICDTVSWWKKYYHLQTLQARIHWPLCKCSYQHTKDDISWCALSLPIGGIIQIHQLQLLLIDALIWSVESLTIVTVSLNLSCHEVLNFENPWRLLPMLAGILRSPGHNVAKDGFCAAATGRVVNPCCDAFTATQWSTQLCHCHRPLPLVSIHLCSLASLLNITRLFGKQRKFIIIHHVIPSVL